MKNLIKKSLPQVIIPLMSTLALAGCSSYDKSPFKDDSPTVQWLKDYDAKNANIDSQEVNPYVLSPSQVSQETLTITESNLFETLLRNNPDIEAGRYSSEVVRLLTEYNQTQYQPQISVRTRSEYKRTEIVTGDERFKETIRRYRGDAVGEVAVSQQFPWGLEGKVFVDLDANTDNTRDDNLVRYGVEAQYFIPGLSFTLAERQLNDLIRLQEPAKDRASFVSDMRSKLLQVVDFYYNRFMGNSGWLYVQGQVFHPHLLEIEGILKDKEDVNPNDARVKSDIQKLEGVIGRNTNLINHHIPGEIRKTERTLLSILGSENSHLAYEPIDLVLEVDYEGNLRDAVVNDPQIQRFQIELDIAKAQMKAAEKDIDVSIFAGASRGIDKHSENEAFVGISLTYLTAGRDVLREAYSVKRLGFAAKIRSRIADLTTEIYRIRENIAIDSEIMKKEVIEEERKKLAFEQALNSFRAGEEWATLDRVLDLLEDRSASALEIVDTKKRITTNVAVLSVLSGKYDKN